MAIPPIKNRLSDEYCDHLRPSRIFAYDDTKIKILVGEL